MNDFSRIPARLFILNAAPTMDIAGSIPASHSLRWRFLASCGFYSPTCMKAAFNHRSVSDTLLAQMSVLGFFYSVMAFAFREIQVTGILACRPENDGLNSLNGIAERLHGLIVEYSDNGETTK